MKIIKSIAEYFFKQDMYSKLVRVNFIAILCNGTINMSITEQEVVPFNQIVCNQH